MEHIDWVPRLWRAGVIKLTPLQRSVYFDIINETYALGSHPVEDYRWLSGVCNMSPRQLKRIVSELIALGKLTREEPEDGEDGPVLVANRTRIELERANDRVNSYKLRALQRGRNVKNQRHNIVCSDGNNTKQNNTPLSPFRKMEETACHSPDAQVQSAASDQASSAGKPEPADGEAPGETEDPEAARPLPSSRASPQRQRLDSPRARGTNARAIGANPRAIGTNPRGRPPPIVLPDGPEEVRRAFEVVATEHGAVRYANWMAGCAASAADGKVVVTAPSAAHRDWISTHYLADMQRAAGVPIEVVVGTKCRD